MTEGYREWQHPDGALPEAAPEGLIDVYAAPWLADQAVPPGSVPSDGGALLWGLAAAAFVLLLLLAGWLWHRRGDLRLAVVLWRLERDAAKAVSPADLRAVQDRLVTAIGRWQHGRSAPQRGRLRPPWSAWVREIDHARFGRNDAAGQETLVKRLREMRRSLWRAQGAS